MVPNLRFRHLSMLLWALLCVGVAVQAASEGANIYLSLMWAAIMWVLGIWFVKAALWMDENA